MHIMRAEETYLHHPVYRHGITSCLVDHVTVNIIRHLPDISTDVSSNFDRFRVIGIIEQRPARHYCRCKNGELFTVVLKGGEDVHVIPCYTIDDSYMGFVKMEFWPAVNRRGEIFVTFYDSYPGIAAQTHH